MDDLTESIQKIKKCAETISQMCEDCLAHPERITPSKRNNLMLKTEEYSTLMYSNASKVGYPPAIEKRLLQRYEYMAEFTEILQVDDDCIHFRIPLLPRKQSKQDIAIFSISYVFHSIVAQFGAVPIMPKNTIEFTFVYPSSNEDAVLDHDNYAATKAINTIMVFIRSSDKGTNSWLSYKTIISDELIKGTYVKIIRRN